MPTMKSGKFEKERFYPEDFTFLKHRKVSGIYKGPVTRSGISSIAAEILLELRVDIDGRRPQKMVSGDIYEQTSLFGFKKIKYKRSFQLSKVDIKWKKNKVIITGFFVNKLQKVDMTVTIPIAPVFTSAPNAVINITIDSFSGGPWTLAKTSEYLRETTLEVDSISGTAFPPTVNTDIEPHPDDLSHIDMNIATAYKRAGINMVVTHDEVLTDPDNSDLESGWDYGELHDLMELRFSHFSNNLQWNLYGIIVTASEEGWSGIMFDWAGGQPGDTYLRQGFAVAYDSITSLSGDLYDTDEKKNRKFLWTLVHEAGHAFNLPHVWSRNDNPDPASTSFMNYTWLYSGGAAGADEETEYWGDFRWEFDDVELAWMRHADRNDVIFGGTNWIWNNLSESDIFTQQEISGSPISLAIRSNGIYDLCEPVILELALMNTGQVPVKVPARLFPEEGFISVMIERPDKSFTAYKPPIRADFTSMPVETLSPQETMNSSCELFYGKYGFLFDNPGEYWLRAAVMIPGYGTVISNPFRIRIASPRTQSAEKLAYLMFDRRFGRFKYLAGCRAFPELISELEEACEKFGKTEPSAVRHIHTALGSLYGRNMKNLSVKNDKKTITVVRSDIKNAIDHFNNARSMIRTSSMDIADRHVLKNIITGISYCHMKNKNKSEAEKNLNEGTALLENAGFQKDLITREKDRILKKKTR